MYLRWQYLGPVWVRDRRIVASEPRALSDAFRYRLSVVEARRDAVTAKPRQRVVLYLGVVNEAVLMYWPPRERLAARNRLIDGFSMRLRRAVEQGRITPEQRTTIGAALNAAFPKPPAPMVVIPASVRQHAAPRAIRDIQAAARRVDERGLSVFNAMRELTGDAPVSLDQFTELLKRATADKSGQSWP